MTTSNQMDFLTERTTSTYTLNSAVQPVALAASVVKELAIGGFGVEKPSRKFGIARTRVILHEAPDRGRDRCFGCSGTGKQRHTNRQIKKRKTKQTRKKRTNKQDTQS